MVDVLDVDRALLDAGAAGRAGPQHVRVDDAVDLRAADQRPLGLLEPSSGRPVRSSSESASRYGALAKAWSRRSRISSLGDRGFPVFQAGHCDWQRPHSVQVAKSSRPFQVKSSILPRAEDVLVGVGLLEVEHLPVAHHRLDRAQAVGAAA